MCDTAGPKLHWWLQNTEPSWEETSAADISTHDGFRKPQFCCLFSLLLPEDLRLFVREPQLEAAKCWCPYLTDQEGEIQKRGVDFSSSYRKQAFFFFSSLPPQIQCYKKALNNKYIHNPSTASSFYLLLPLLHQPTETTTSACACFSVSSSLLSSADLLKHFRDYLSSSESCSEISACQRRPLNTPMMPNPAWGCGCLPPPTPVYRQNEAFAVRLWTSTHWQ